MAGFRVAGIHPFNRNIFTEADFLLSYVTNRPNPVIKDTVSAKLPRVETNKTNLPLNTSNETTEATPPSFTTKTKKASSISSVLVDFSILIASTFKSYILTPEDICPLPKAGDQEIIS
ncbi:hypothetical protein ILUMI_14381 [Ignelater luminosus]|uniref:Uncharacterized protein n=1 Tax=Ignelater luminosus TaxID=2038154 RepID=A0A8K0G7T7_IGNLU|nr:hypothetical protein ILUMI_14381 [Ignelater luminosus]